MTDAAEATLLAALAFVVTVLEDSPSPACRWALDDLRREHPAAVAAAMFAASLPPDRRGRRDD